MQSELFGIDNRLDGLPDAELRYVESFWPQPEQAYQALSKEIAWRQDTIQMYGKPVVIPRLNAWYGDPDAGYSYSGLELAPLPWTTTLQAIREAVEGYTGERFNSVLANLYRDGNDSVAWHSDDEFELGEQPLIASVSFGATRRFSLRHRRRRELATLNLELDSGSLLIMAGATQAHWYHCVPKQKGVTEGRINLTFRQILRSRKGRRAL